MSILLANLHLLFWLSLVPFTTGWMGQNPMVVAPALPSCLMAPAMAQVIDALIAMVWLIPDRRIERLLHQD